MKPIIEVQNLSKLYQIGAKEAYGSLRDEIMQAITAPFRRLKPDTSNLTSSTDTNLWALKDVSFEVNEGEVVGIIGRNGAGKSTLLKILSRITEPTSGKITMRGRVASLLEVGTGFHPELTGRENIFLNGALLGMTNAEIKSKFDEIVAFSEIEKFLDTPVKRYSSGMYVRLAFAVAAHLEPEILVVDEVLAVGDAEFQKKCLGKMGDVAKGGRTVLFVSHNMGAVKQLCGKCLCIERGAIVNAGNTNEVVDVYLKESQRIEAHAEKKIVIDKEKDFQVISVRLLNEEGEVSRLFQSDGSIIIELSCIVNKQVPGLYGYLMISKIDGTIALEGDSFDVAINPFDNLPAGEHLIHVNIPPRTLAPGDYTLWIDFSSPMSAGKYTLEELGIVSVFTLNDHITRRGDRRRGCVGTLLQWNLIKEMTNV